MAPAVVLAMVSVAGARSLLTPVTPARHALPHGVARGRALALGRAALAELRTRTTAVVPDFPLGGDATVELELRRFEPFAPGARVEAVDGRGVRAVKLPDHVYFTGMVRGEPGSRVLLIAARDHVRGFVAARGTVYPFGPDRRGRHRSYALRDVDPTAYPRPGAFCANDLHRDQVDSLLVNRSARVAAGLEPPPIASEPNRAHSSWSVSMAASAWTNPEDVYAMGGGSRPAATRALRFTSNESTWSRWRSLAQNAPGRG